MVKWNVEIWNIEWKRFSLRALTGWGAVWHTWVVLGGDLQYFKQSSAGWVNTTSSLGYWRLWVVLGGQHHHHHRHCDQKKSWRKVHLWHFVNLTIVLVKLKDIEETAPGKETQRDKKGEIEASVNYWLTTTLNPPPHHHGHLATCSSEITPTWQYACPKWREPTLQHLQRRRLARSQPHRPLHLGQGFYFDSNKHM